MSYNAPTPIQIDLLAVSSLLASWNRTVVMDASGGARTVTLPTAVGNQGLLVQVKKSDPTGNAVTVLPNGAETIDGAASFVIRSENDSVILISDGVNVQAYSEYLVNEFVIAEKTADQAIAVVAGGVDVTWVNPTGNIPFASPFFTLSPGRTYELMAGLRFFSLNGVGQVTTRWTDSADIDVGVGSIGNNNTATVAGNSTTQCIACVHFTPAVSTTVKVKAETGAGAGTIGLIPAFARIRRIA